MGFAAGRLDPLFERGSKEMPRGARINEFLHGSGVAMRCARECASARRPVGSSWAGCSRETVAIVLSEEDV
jgi:hypothetical protein